MRLVQSLNLLHSDRQWCIVVRLYGMVCRGFPIAPGLSRALISTRRVEVLLHFRCTAPAPGYR